MKYQVLLRGGRVLDPASGLDAQADAAFSDGVLADVGDIHGDAAQVIDVSGCLVVPGLVDLHLHVRPYSPFGVPGEVCWAQGVTAAADAGGAGVLDYQARRALAGTVGLTLRTFLNVSSGGLTLTFDEDIDPARFDRQGMARILRECPETVGLKLRMGKECARTLGAAPVRQAAALARELGTRLMVHCTNPPVPMRVLADALGQGDILTHVYHGHGESLLAEGGLDALRRARERGVLLDAAEAHGWHLSFSVFRAALEAGLGPDTVSTDLTFNSMASGYCGCAFQLNAVMSRMLALGMPLMPLLRAVTETPARCLGLPAGFGTLTPGVSGDAAVLQLLPSDRVHTDSLGDSLPVRTLVVCQATLCRGKPVWRDPRL